MSHVSSKRSLALVLISLAFFVSFFQNCGTPISNPPNAPAGLAKQNSSSTPSPTPALPGPINGRYSLGSWTCGTNDIFNQAQSPLGVRMIGLEINGSQVKQNTLFFSSCTSSQAYTYSFPTGSTLSMLVGVRTCSGSCGSTECFYQGAPVPARSYGYGYVKSGAALTLTRVLTNVETQDPLSPYKMAGCQTGQTETLVFTQ